MTHPDPFTDNTAMDKLMSEISKADEGGGPEMRADTEMIALSMLSLRDYFAAQAIGSLSLNEHTTIRDDAHSAYLIADAMLEARKVKK